MDRFFDRIWSRMTVLIHTRCRSRSSSTVFHVPLDEIGLWTSLVIVVPSSRTSAFSSSTYPLHFGTRTVHRYQYTVANTSL